MNVMDLREATGVLKVTSADPEAWTSDDLEPVTPTEQPDEQNLEEPDPDGIESGAEQDDEDEE